MVGCFLNNAEQTAVRNICSPEATAYIDLVGRLRELNISLVEHWKAMPDDTEYTRFYSLPVQRNSISVSMGPEMIADPSDNFQS